MSHKYLSKELFSKEDWEGVRDWDIFINKEDAHTDPFPCGRKQKPKRDKMVFMGVLLLVVVVLVAFVNRDLFKRRSRRIHPLNANNSLRTRTY